MLNQPKTGRIYPDENTPPQNPYFMVLSPQSEAQESQTSNQHLLQHVGATENVRTKSLVKTIEAQQQQNLQSVPQTESPKKCSETTVVVRKRRG